MSDTTPPTSKHDGETSDDGAQNPGLVRWSCALIGWVSRTLTIQDFITSVY